MDEARRCKQKIVTSDKSIKTIIIEKEDQRGDF